MTQGKACLYHRRSNGVNVVTNRCDDRYALPMTTIADTDTDSALTESTRLNWLRAAVLGANDGIVSVAATVIGVVAATTSTTTIAISAVAALSAGSLSMAAGEYVSVSSQRDAEKLNRERAKERGATQEEINELPLTSPTHAAVASFLAFFAGGIIPAVVVLASWGGHRDLATAAAVLIALALTGWISAKASGVRPGPAIRRVMVGGSLAMAVTYGIGSLVGIAL